MKAFFLSSLILSSSIPNIQTKALSEGEIKAGEMKYIPVSDGNAEKQRISENLRFIDQHLKKGYLEKGFTDEEAQVISDSLKEAHIHRDVQGLAQIEKAVLSASKRLGLSSYQIDKINEVNLDAFTKILSFIPFELMKSCIQTRSEKLSECTKGYVEGFLKQAENYARDGELDSSNRELKNLRDQALSAIKSECSENPSSEKFLLKLNLQACDQL